jgi:hypothetical protein
VTLIITDLSEEHIASTIRATTIGELGTTLAITSNSSILRLLITVFLRIVLRLLVTANVVPSLSILATQMMEAISSSETLVLTRATQNFFAECFRC